MWGVHVGQEVAVKVAKKILCSRVTTEEPNKVISWVVKHVDIAFHIAPATNEQTTKPLVSWPKHGRDAIMAGRRPGGC